MSDWYKVTMCTRFLQESVSHWLLVTGEERSTEWGHLLTPVPSLSQAQPYGQTWESRL